RYWQPVRLFYLLISDTCLINNTGNFFWDILSFYFFFLFPECTQCVGSSYEVAVCTSTQDTICIDVTFPLKQFQSNALPIEDLVSWNVTLSKNVFLERLQSIKKLETTLYLSSNKQALQFVWRRPNSGLEIHVKASDVYLIPEYVDVDHKDRDDEKFVMKANTFPEDIKNLLRSIRRSHCRHPLPDEYELNLDIAKNIATPAREFPCDTKNRNGPECPHGYKDGDMYVYQILDRLCPKVDTTRSQTFGYSSNNILCSGNTEMLKSIFNMEVDDPTFLNFPSEECKKSEENCGRCLSRDACDRGSNLTDCCNIGCHQLTDCKRYFSAQCPNAPIECARGEVI
ncbi:uncharacterized protein LOC132738880, partial [Ruditapes philippinarum]|uniref:uncharacterized protein LOC132738880 n=1 Tax=Ruditapes philippinarum TaxID=129788 RepID=UPI00295ADA42